MKKLLFIVSMLGLMLFYTGCSEDSATDTQKIADVSLSPSMSVVCTNESTFSVKPIDDPLVNFSTDVDSLDTNISVSSESSGYVTIENCTQR